MKIKCIVVDDEYLARVLLEDYIKKVPGLELVAKCESALEAMEVLNLESIDLMFLDIQMPDISGLTFVKSLKQKPITIFTTAYAEYALEGYALDVIDYLLKPFSFERFVSAVNKATNQIELQKKGAANDQKKFIVLKSDHRLHKVEYDNILYVEGLKEYVRFHLKEGSRITTLKSLKELEESLPNNFMRIHRSYIVNKDYVKSLYGNSVEIENTKLLIGKTYKHAVVENLFT